MRVEEDDGLVRQCRELRVDARYDIGNLSVQFVFFTCGESDLYEYNLAAIVTNARGL